MGQSITEFCRGLGITNDTYYRWRNDCRGLRVDLARRRKELEEENSRLGKISLQTPPIVEKAIMKESASENWLARPNVAWQ